MIIILNLHSGTKLPGWLRHCLYCIQIYLNVYDGADQKLLIRQYDNNLQYLEEIVKILCITII